MKRPLAVICIYYLTGTAAAIYADSFNTNVAGWICAAAIASVLTLFAAVQIYGFNKLYILVMLIAFVFGALNFLNRNAALKQSFKDYSGAKLTVGGVILSEPDIGEQYTSYVFKVQYVYGIEKSAASKAILRIRNTADGTCFGYGIHLEADASIEFPKTARNPGGFNFRGYLASKGISVILNAESACVATGNGGNPLIRLGYYLKNKIIKVIDLCLPKQQAGLLKGMLIGCRDGLGPEVEEVFRNAGLSHIMAVSGANLVFLIAPLLFIFRRIGIGRNYSNTLVILAIALFTLIAGFEPSVLRAALMAVIILLGGVIKREADVITSISAAAVLLVIINPFCLLDVGFQLSFGATLSLVFFSRPILSIVNKLSRFGKLNELIAATLAAQLGVIPISVFHFNSVSAISLLSNIIVVPVTGVVTITGMCIAVMGQFCMPLANLTANFNCALLSFILYVTDLSAKIPFSLINIKTPSIFMIIAWYSLLFVIRSRLDAVRKATAFSLLLIIAVIGCAFPLSPGLEIIHFDVEFGDSALIRTSEGHTILIDAGYGSFSGGSAGERVVIPYLRHVGINKLDLVIGTHAHNDHIGGMKDVIEGIYVKNIAVSPFMMENDSIHDLIEACNAYGTRVIVLSKGDRIKMNKDAIINILHPGTADNNYSLNNQSMVIKLSYKEAEFLFTGDMETEAEKTVMDEGFDLSSDILKVAHHGSNSSTTSLFLERVNPAAAIISVGKNSFGHPAAQTLQRLKQFNTEVYRTDWHGAIRITTDGRTIKVKKMVN